MFGPQTADGLRARVSALWSLDLSTGVSFHFTRRIVVYSVKNMQTNFWGRPGGAGDSGRLAAPLLAP